MTVASMIKDLMELGYSQKYISEQVGVAQPTICRAYKGGSIKYEAGKALERLHARLVPACASRAA